jgi:hypothetical protein
LTWRPLPGTRSPGTPKLERAPWDALPAASDWQKHLPTHGSRGQLCPSAIPKPSDIFHGYGEIAKRGENGRVSAPSHCRSPRRGSGGGSLARREPGNCDPSIIKRIIITRTRESQIHPPGQWLWVWWPFLALAPWVAVKPTPCHAQPELPFCGRRNKRDPHPLQTHLPPDILPLLLKVFIFANLLVTPSPPE